jgi:hypothetical protein
VSAAFATALAVFVLSPAAPPSREGWLWLVACFAGELLWVRLPLDRATISMSACFNFAAAILLPQREAMLAVAISVFAAELVVMRKPAVRAVFNSAQTALATAAAAATFHLVSGGSQDLESLLRHAQVLPFLGAAASYYLANRLAVSLAVAASRRVSPAAAWRANFRGRHELLSSATLFSLGLLVALCHQRVGMAGTLLVALPLVIVCDGYRRHLDDADAETAMVQSAA